MIFLSTPSARRATFANFHGRHHIGISIHALREEGDYSSALDGILPDLFLSTPSARRATCYSWAEVAGALDFYPRPPRGGRLSLTPIP